MTEQQDSGPADNPARVQTDPSEDIHRTKLKPHQRKALVAGSIGNVVEWVDWAVYATLAPIFASQFFPKSDPAAALLSTLAVFAVGFVMRPIGGAVLGAYADRHGRKKGLTLTIGLMAGAALVIAVCPTYEQIGIAAPIVLLLARLVQGLSAGGEFGSSSAFLVESAAPERRAFAGSWQQVSVGAGALIASLMGTILTSVLSTEAMASYGWRIAFGIGGLLGFVGLWLRTSVAETEHFQQLQEKRATQTEPHRHPLLETLTKHPGAALRVMGITIAGTLTYYIWISYMPGFARSSAGIPLRDGLLANTIALIYFLCILPFVALLSDRIGRKPTLLGFAIGFMLFAYPGIAMIQGGFWMLLLSEIIGLTLLAGYSANTAAVMAEQFPAEVRTTGIGLPYALAVALFGGTAPYITTWMNTNGYGQLVWIYVAAACLVGVIVYATMPETKGRPLK
ncbi:MHS family alpha-ketoglutarate permease-like MFS transporter [Propionibacteriaceae bacterium ES.041]|uniref:Putative proline/betaine transporter n=1 Tax=Enemella evansiae TaxID=2016499 RepID=A0A255GKL9_9ACTN|nr:MFS transporter [Enemella evansiae]OYO02922.1 MFS transporter [Enemella evansiae]OYO12219.1 MFS transporter [Enemella evansiae]OYO16378.1 MFS transporter [Enemella evansiae]PFG69336.1 MHS family alpha-ketoglutarate permease-like MFS transporter [Propionibacteriaceae bacterium ES.041]